MFQPIVAGVEWFTAFDEKYVCQVDTDVDIFLCGTDPVNPGNVCGWCKQIGEGRTATISPGHTMEISEHPGFRKLLKNAVRWCKGENAAN